MDVGLCRSSAVALTGCLTAAPTWLVAVLLSIATQAAVAQSAATLPLTVRTQFDPFDRLSEIEQGRVASTWTSLPNSSRCQHAEREWAAHVLGLAEPTSAATERHTGSFDLIDPRHRVQLDATVQIGCVFGQLAAQLQVGVDGNFWSADGSALSWQIDRHWRVGAGWIARQWGPAWDGSLILGTAARALPSVSVDADSGSLADSGLWWWLGQVQFTAFVGQLESRRQDYARPWLAGLRAVIRPVPWLQLGASRVAQIGGEGRNNSLGAFWDALLGHDNQIDRADLYNQPGNQLGGFDARIDLDRWLGGWALYGQMIGEDEAANLPSKYMYQLGASWRHRRGMFFIEWTDSTARDPGVAYNHVIYTDGFRSRGRPLGYWADGDSSVWTLGALWNTQAFGQGLAVIRSGRLNDAGASPTWPNATLFGASLQWRTMLDLSVRLTLAADYLRLSDRPVAAGTGRDHDAQLRVQLEWWPPLAGLAISR